MLQVLQAGRALAAISVAAFHLSIFMGLDRYGGNAVFRDFTSQGNRGVDFFFVLSGFIILFAHVHDIGKPAAWKEYAYRRFVRLYPIYWVYTGVFVLLLSLGLGTDAKYPSNAGDWLTSLTLIRFTDGAPPLLVAWTLFHEMAFYAAFSILILSKRIGIIVLSLAACVCLALYHFPETNDRNAFNVYTAAYNLYFLFGMGAYWLYKRGGRGIIEFVAGLCIALAALTISIPFDLSSIVLVAGFSLIVAGATKLEMAGYIKVPVFLAFIGNASYSLYLVHESLEGLLLKIARKTHFYDAAGPEVTYVVVLAATVALGCLTYALVEKPLLAALHRLHKKKRLAVATAATAS